MVLQLYRTYPGCELYEECVKDYNYVPPGTMEEWEHSLNLFTGFESIEKRAWVADKKFMRTVLFYAYLANLQIRAPGAGYVQKAVVRLVKKIASFRISRRFWGLPLDTRLILFFDGMRRKVVVPWR